MDRLDLLQGLIIKGQDLNHEEHQEISRKLEALESQVVDIRIWKAKVLGGAAALSAAISVGGWVLGHFIR